MPKKGAQGRTLEAVKEAAAPLFVKFSGKRREALLAEFVEDVNVLLARWRMLISRTPTDIGEKALADACAMLHVSPPSKTETAVEFRRRVRPIYLRAVRELHPDLRRDPDSSTTLLEEVVSAWAVIDEAVRVMAASEKGR